MFVSSIDEEEGVDEEEKEEEEAEGIIAFLGIFVLAGDLVGLLVGDDLAGGVGVGMGGGGAATTGRGLVDDFVDELEATVVSLSLVSLVFFTAFALFIICFTSSSSSVVLGLLSELSLLELSSSVSFFLVVASVLGAFFPFGTALFVVLLWSSLSESPFLLVPPLLPTCSLFSLSVLSLSLLVFFSGSLLS